MGQKKLSDYEEKGKTQSPEEEFVEMTAYLEKIMREGDSGLQKRPFAECHCRY